MRRASCASTRRRSSSRGWSMAGADGGRGDLVEDHAHHRHPGREHLGEVPGDRLAFAVLVCREVDLARRRDELAELGDLLALLPRTRRRSGLKSLSTSTPRRAQGSDLKAAGTSAAERGRSRMWPIEDSTT